MNITPGTLKTKKDIIHDNPTITAKGLKLRVQGIEGLQLCDFTSTSLPQIQQEITELWTKRMDDILYLKGLVNTMPSRLEDVIRRDDNTAKY